MRSAAVARGSPAHANSAAGGMSSVGIVKREAWRSVYSSKRSSGCASDTLTRCSAEAARRSLASVSVASPNVHVSGRIMQLRSALYSIACLAWKCADTCVPLASADATSPSGVMRTRTSCTTSRRQSQHRLKWRAFGSVRENISSLRGYPSLDALYQFRCLWMAPQMTCWRRTFSGVLSMKRCAPRSSRPMCCRHLRSRKG